MRRFVLPAAGVLLLAGGLSAWASTPATSGTFGPTAGAGSITKAWSGTVAGANPNGSCLDSVDDSVNDHHTFTLSVPAGFYAGGRTVTMSITELASAADTIVTVTKGGKSIGSSDNGSVGAAEGTTLTNPTSGTFDVITCSFAGASPYDASVTLKTSFATVGGPVGGTSTTAATSSYGNYPLTAIPGTGSSGEPSIGVDWNTGNVYFQANLNTVKAVFPDKGKGVGAPTLTDVSCALTTANTLDPILFTDSVSGNTGVSQLAANPAGLNSITNFFTGDPTGPQTLCNLSQGGGEIAGPDHQTLGGGAYPKVLPTGVTAGSTHPLYYCSQTIAAGALCARSDNGGTTFLNGLPPYTTECGGLHGHVRVGPEGTVYLPNKSCGSTQGVAVSTDAGQSWTINPVTGSTPSDGSDPAVSADRSGRVYFAGVGSDGRPFASVSTTQGKTWKAPISIGDAVKIKNSVYPEVIAGDSGRAAISFLGTTTAGDRNAAGFGENAAGTSYTGGVFDLFVSTTVDGGATWKTQDITPKDPVQRGIICTDGTTCPSGRNLLDFNDMTVDKQGRAIIGYSDGCTGACVTSTKVADNKQAAQGVIARENTGPLLFVAPGTTVTGTTPQGSTPSKPSGSSGPGGHSASPGTGGKTLANTGLTTTLPLAGVALLLVAIGVRRRRA